MSQFHDWLFFDRLYGLAVTRPAAQAQIEMQKEKAQMQMDQMRLQMQVDGICEYKLGVPKKTTYDPCSGCGSSDFIARPHGMTCTYCRALQ